MAGPVHLFQLFFPSVAQVPLVFAIGFIGLLCMGLGRLVSADAGPAGSLVAGWGLAVFAFVAVGTLTPAPLWVAAAVLLLPALGGLFLLARGGVAGDPAWRGAGRVLLLSLPLILIAAAMRASQWDDFTHWLPNGQFLAIHDRFPSLATPNTGSAWPAYPYALPLVGYASSLITGFFSDRAGILFNLLLLLSGAWLIADIISRANRNGTAAPGSALNLWTIAAAALLIVVTINPSLALSILYTNNADNATSCVLAVLLVAAARWFDAANARSGDRYSLAFICGCCATVLVELKQSNVVLLAVFAIAFGIVMLAERRRFESGWLSALVALPMPLLAFVMWRRYCETEMPNGAMPFLPYAQWHFAEMDEMLTSALTMMLRKSGHFGMMIGLVAAAAVSFRRSSSLDLESRRYVRAVALLFLGYTAFLFFAYLVSFSVSEATDAASFWRYSTHLGMSGLAAATALVAPRWRVAAAWSKRLSIATIALVVVLPWANGKRIRLDLDKPHEGYSMEVAREMAPMLPGGAHIALVDLYGSAPSLAVMQYELIYRTRRDLPWPPFTVGIRRDTNARAYFPSPGRTARNDDYVWIDNGGPGTKELLGVDLKPGAGYLLKSGLAGFSVVRSWPDTPEQEEFSPEDFR